MKLFGILPEEVWILLILAVDISALIRKPRSAAVLKLRTYPADQIIHQNAGANLVIRCRDEGPLRAAVSWKREDGKPIKPGSIDKNGRLEIFDLSISDAGTYVCQASKYLKSDPDGSKKTVKVIVEEINMAVCSPPSATCRDGKCIQKSSMCDGIKDCSDGLDEVNCGVSLCEMNEYQCTNKKCVLKTWYCDGDNDCGDNSDEANCSESVAPPNECLSNEFKCEVGDQCVPRSFYCDGQDDCLDGSDELHCEPPRIISLPSPEFIRVKPGGSFTLECQAAGEPVPLISWRLNTGSVPESCASTTEGGVGVLTCYNVQAKDTGAYSCEAYNSKGLVFALNDAVVNVTDGEVCPDGYFNSEARSSAACERCFCFGQSTQCRSADLFENKMAAPLGEESTKLIGVKLGEEEDIINKKVNKGAMVVKNMTLKFRSYASKEENLFPYLSLPDAYKGNQLLSYGGFIQYRIDALTSEDGGNDDENVPYIIIVGKYVTLVYLSKKKSNETSIDVDARLTPEHWVKASPDGFAPTTREDIMMTLIDINLILLRVTINGGGVTDFGMSSAGLTNLGRGTANLVEECTCPPGYEGLSCQDCAPGFVHSQGRWLGKCVPELPNCQPGTYRPEGSLVCIPCPCSSTSQDFATSCPIGPKDFICNCKNGTPEFTNSTVQSSSSSTDVIVRIIGSPLIDKEVGGIVNFTCEARDLKYSRSIPVEWGKMDGELPLGRYKFDSTTGLLTITNLQLSDSGNYICTARLGAGNTGEAIANLKVHQDETGQRNGTVSLQEVIVAINPPVQIMEEGSNVNFSCQAFNQKTFTRLPVLWTKSAGDLPLGRHQIDWQTGSLLIKDVQISDNGTYTCHVLHDENNDVMENSDLKVLTQPGHTNGLTKSLPKPSILVKITSPSVLKERVGNNINFTCEAYSRITSIYWPPSQRRLPITWIKIGSELPHGRHEIDEKNGRLLLTDLRFSDSGMYACIASDGINIAQDLASLKIEEDLELRI